MKDLTVFGQNGALALVGERRANDGKDLVAPGAPAGLLPQA